MFVNVYVFVVYLLLFMLARCLVFWLKSCPLITLYNADHCKMSTISTNFNDCFEIIINCCCFRLLVCFLCLTLFYVNELFILCHCLCFYLIMSSTNWIQIKTNIFKQYHLVIVLIFLLSNIHILCHQNVGNFDPASHPFIL